MLRSDTTSYAMLVMAALIFASNLVIGRHLGDVLPPFGTAFWSFAIGAMVTLPFAGLAFVKNWSHIRANFWFFLFLLLKIHPKYFYDMLTLFNPPFLVVVLFNWKLINIGRIFYSLDLSKIHKIKYLSV